jgi:hypothetical protein
MSGPDGEAGQSAAPTWLAAAASAVLHPLLLWACGAGFAVLACDAIGHGQPRYGPADAMAAAILSAGLFVAAALRQGRRPDPR